MGQDQKCSACDAQIDSRRDGVELWGAWFCSKCFISNAAKTHKELTPDDILLLRRIGKELAGFLPQDLLEMILVGFHKRSGGTGPLPGELSRCVGEVQRLSAFACFRQIMNLLKNWQTMFNEFVDQEETEIRSKIRQLTDFDDDKP
jgi:hypothetical protein